jgi:1,4-alpha-glucan branching enzyme
MPGDRWQRFANLRAYFGFMWGHPGKKLLFMGGELAQEREWNHDIGLDWQLLEDPLHRGVQRLVRDLNRLYLTVPALYALDCEGQGFAWLTAENAEDSVLAFARFGRKENDVAVVVCNFTPVVRHDYRLGVPRSGRWHERLNSDAAAYGGSGVGNAGEATAEPHPMHGHAQSLRLVLPPLTTLILTPEIGG